MKTTLVCHASVIIRSTDATILTDPWFIGKCFNDSWGLHPLPAFQESTLDEITHLWVSHEHPDHFHIPTLKSLPMAFKERVQLLFQRNNSDKMFEAFRKFGFRNLQALPHRQIVRITPGTEVYCHQVGPMDSMLGVISGGETLLSVNDCEINDHGCRLALDDLKRVDVVLNQFSFAGYTGQMDYKEHAQRLASAKLASMLANHIALKTKVSIPFASFMYFCCSDNAHLNPFANTLREVAQRFREKGQELAVLYPGDTFDSQAPYDSEPALARFDQAHQQVAGLPVDTVAPVPLDRIEESFRKLAIHLKEKYGGWVLRRLKPVTADLADLDSSVRFSLAEGTFERRARNPDADLLINSQPLFFAFAFPFGVQTLGVSGRYFVQHNEANWRRHRILTSMNNAEVYLRPKYFFTRRNLEFFRERLPGVWNQVRYQLQRMT